MWNIPRNYNDKIKSHQSEWDVLFSQKVKEKTIMESQIPAAWLQKLSLHLFVHCVSDIGICFPILDSIVWIFFGTGLSICSILSNSNFEHHHVDYSPHAISWTLWRCWAYRGTWRWRWSSAGWSWSHAQISSRRAGLRGVFNWIFS